MQTVWRSMTLAVIAGVLSLPALASSQGTIVFRDDFNRPDASTLGTPWTEANESLTGFPTTHWIDPGFIELDSESLAFHYIRSASEHNAGPYAFAPLANPVQRPTLSFTISPHFDERMSHYIGLMTSAHGFFNEGYSPAGIDAFVPNSGIAVLLSRTSRLYSGTGFYIVSWSGGAIAVVAAGPAPSFDVSYGHTYSVTLEIEPSGAVVATLSNGATTVVRSGVVAGVPLLDQVFISDPGAGVSSSSPSGDHLLRFDDLTVLERGTLTVAIDIKPGSATNSVNLGSAGVVPVAILSTAFFDATSVIPESVSLAGARVRLVGKSERPLCHAEDSNEDGRLDLVCQVVTAEFMIETGESTAVLEAMSGAGAIRGEDIVRIVP